MLCSVLSGGDKCCSPVMCAWVCAATSSSQVVAVSGPFRPVTSSAPVVSGGAVAAEKSPPVCEGELCGVSSPSVRLGWNRPCLFAVLALGCPLRSVHMHVTLSTHMCETDGHQKVGSH